MEKHAIYLYGITSLDRIIDLNIPGIAQESNLYCIEYQDIKAVVSNVPLEEYDQDAFAQNVEDIEWLKEKAVLHSNIVNGLFNASRTLIPLSFGTIFLSKENVNHFLMENYHTLKQNLDKINEKEEWGVKLFCDINKFIETNMDDEKKLILEQTSDMSTGARYFLQKKLTTNIEDMAKNKVIALSQKLFNELSTKSCERKLNKLLSREATGVPHDMYMNSVFLLNINNLESFEKTIENYKKEYEKTGIHIIHTGPWPPYNFYCI